MRQCKVFIHGIYAGILKEIDMPHGYEFSYDENYISNKGEPVSLRMPLRTEPYQSAVLFPFFFNMLSEGENRIIQASYLRLDKEDDFGILLQTAQYDTPGAVTVQPIL